MARRVGLLLAVAQLPQEPRVEVVEERARASAGSSHWSRIRLGVLDGVEAEAALEEVAERAPGELLERRGGHGAARAPRVEPRARPAGTKPS